MKFEDWKEFAKEKPVSGTKIIAATKDCHAVFDYKGIDSGWTHWQPWADPPKPDPFEEYWKTRRMPTVEGGVAYETCKQWCLDGWVGHERWAKDQSEGK